MSGGLVVEPLGHPTRQRLVQLANELDFVAIGGGDIIHGRDDLYSLWYELDPADATALRPSAFFVEGLGAFERSTPMAWHSVGVPFDLEGDLARRVRRACASRAYLSVRDEPSRRRVQAAGVDREVALVPDSAFLLDRVFPPSAVAERKRRLVAQRAYPHDRPPLVLQGGASLLPHLDDIGRSLRTALSSEPDLPVVLLETGLCHRDDEFASALARYLDPRRPFRLPHGFVVDDVVAAIAHSRGFVGSSLHGSVTAYAFDRPFLVLDLLGQSKLASLVDVAGEGEVVSAAHDLAPGVLRLLAASARGRDRERLRSLVDAHFDRLAAHAEASFEARAARPRRVMTPFRRLQAALSRSRRA